MYSKQDKKIMVRKFLDTKTPMGIYAIENLVNGKVYINAHTDVKSTLNSYKFRLKMNSLRIKELQREWNEYGEEAFEFKVLEYLKYDKKDEDRDYSDDLDILKTVWLERLSREGVQLYQWI
ncbi:GIY-YIG nuclease family protein [Clostridiaceae bacterium M8S5]|nr:GIY-YIG nuclease family protein [Clostridiaceae bacterium M8S5]